MKTLLLSIMLISSSLTLANAASQSQMDSSFTCKTTFSVPDYGNRAYTGHGQTMTKAALNAVDNCLYNGWGRDICTGQPIAQDCSKDLALWSCKAMSLDNQFSYGADEDPAIAEIEAIENCQNLSEVPDSCVANCNKIK